MLRGEVWFFPVLFFAIPFSSGLAFLRREHGVVWLGLSSPRPTRSSLTQERHRLRRDQQRRHGPCTNSELDHARRTARQEVHREDCPSTPRRRKAKQPRSLLSFHLGFAHFKMCSVLRYFSYASLDLIRASFAGGGAGLVFVLRSLLRFLFFGFFFFGFFLLNTLSFGFLFARVVFFLWFLVFLRVLLSPVG